MVKRCAWGICNTDTRFPERLEGGVRFFPFPKPKSNPDKCPHSQLNPSRINKHTFVCSKHFVNGEPSPESPNPVPAIPGGGSAVKSRRLPTKRGISTVSGSSVQDTTSEELSMVIEKGGIRVDDKPTHLHIITSDDRDTGLQRWLKLQASLHGFCHDALLLPLHDDGKLFKVSSSREYSFEGR
ncbi:hypothetical protein AALO_G00034470 [Alosa alosa]|uniref:THAP-type domain-containing protein n=1 Tax=Alosa alosa TaxID=278164 RepID=A0AAV6HCW1_9TELE|nr:hypothetical protein AALO_G00034470 [Alosa alosa]